MTSLSDAEVQALHDALNDEYHAWAVYDQVLKDFGPVRPFKNIRDSELRHIEALQHLFRFYNLLIPINPWGTAPMPRFSSLKDASEAGVQAELENVDLYRRILGATKRPDILQVFGHLQAASQERHLPAFQRAAVRFGAEGTSAAADAPEPAASRPGRRYRGGREGCGRGQRWAEGSSV